MRTLGVALLLLASAGAAACGADEDPGPFSTFTGDQLAGSWKNADRFPLLVPATMPAGAEDSDEPGFELADVVVEPTEPAVRRVWLTFYEARALDTTDTQVRVFQRPLDTPPSAVGPCGAASLPHLDRTLGEARLTICGLALASNPKARAYWTSVRFTADYDQVGWIG